MSDSWCFRGVLLPGDIERNLYVRGGRVSFEPTADAHRVINRGWILPGLVDAHCHSGLGHDGYSAAQVRGDLEVDRDAGITIVRDCGSPIDTTWVNDEDDLPRIISCARHIARPKRYIPGIAIEIDPDDFVAEVERQVSAGDGWVKIVGDWIDRGRGDLAPLWTLDQLTAGMQRAHELGARVTAHTFSEEALPDLVRSGIDCIEHGTGVTDEVIDMMVENKTALVPTAINIANFPDFAAAAGKYPVYAEHMLALHAAMPSRIAAAYEAGIPIYAGTDAGGSIKHGRLDDEIRALNGIGLTKADAVGAASWRARNWLGLRGIEEGAEANFTCYDANPLEDLNAFAHPTVIVLRGRLH